MTRATISGSATKAMAENIRKWSGWSDATLLWDDSIPTAQCDHITHTFKFNPSALLLNPSKVLHTLTPFRLRQEAVLTGAVLHEAGHARHSKWQPRTPEASAALRHGGMGPNDPAPTEAVVNFARLFEEPRIEGRMAEKAGVRGTSGLTWTMRASAAHLIPLTKESTDPDQALMNVITSWALRAGREIALREFAGRQYASWVPQFTSLVRQRIQDHLSDESDPLDRNGSEGKSADAVALMLAMITCSDDTGTTMIDLSKRVLEILFPETDNPPTPTITCSSTCSGDGDSGDGDSGDGDSGDGDSGDGDSGASTLERLEQAAKDDAGSDKGQGDKGQGDKGQGGGFDLGLAAGGGSGVSGVGQSGWRPPSPEDRAVQKNAERFLRGLIDKGVVTHTSLTDSPSSQVDGASLAAWKASGESRDPRFFKRTSRVTSDSPPVKIALLVDVSISMSPLQKPSAQLSWALASAALDLRNFAGRGVQVESCLIHWGTTASVIQSNGATLPGIREVPCRDYTYAMADALDLVEREMPGFFDVKDEPENRLIVNFTDWELGLAPSRVTAIRKVQEALLAGVNLLSVTPPVGAAMGYYRESLSGLPHIEHGLPSEAAARSSLIHYDHRNPDLVWSEAARVLSK